ncbi:MAG: hypothetical protein HY071_00295 [Chloroflexi bacterium]|nr:hypothetical protein [Chloroflexota bacterium]
MDDPRVTELLAVRDGPVDTQAALRRFHSALPVQAVRRPVWPRMLAAAAAIAVLFIAFSASGVADSISKIFEAKQVAPVVIGRSDLAGLPDLREFGAISITAQPTTTRVATAAAAAAATGVTPLAATLPAGVSGAPEYTAITAISGTFTFDAATARASAAAKGRTLPPMPATIDHTVLTGTSGPAVVTTYGGSLDKADPKVADTAKLPKLVIARAKAPAMTSNGASLDELRAYLLAQPGISPQLASQIRAIGDPATTLPIVVPFDVGTSRAITVHGTQGVAIGDSTGLGSGVIWVQGGFVNFVGGTLTESQVLGVANSLR